VVNIFLLENTSWVVCIICFIRLSPKCILARRYYVSTALGGSYRCGCNCICTRLSASTSTTGFSLHPDIMKEKLRSPEEGDQGVGKGSGQGFELAHVGSAV
jgi:hypothetical protein